ncbi:MAG TPA: hypothetical protein ENI64_08260 [Gammaproteobacteria bacterium]|nr:hypothetical protein [Gammaproteobacteria bacterium]
MNITRQSGNFLANFTRMDITSKYSLALISGLVILFSATAYIMYGQQSTALEKLLLASDQVIKK